MAACSRSRSLSLLALFLIYSCRVLVVVSNFSPPWKNFGFFGFGFNFKLARRVVSGVLRHYATPANFALRTLSIYYLVIEQVVSIQSDFWWFHSVSGLAQVVTSINVYITFFLSHSLRSNISSYLPLFRRDSYKCNIEGVYMCVSRGESKPRA